MRNLVVFFLLVLTITVHAQMDPILNEINSALGRDGITAKDYVIGIGTADKTLSNAEERAMENAIAEVYNQVAENFRAIILVNRETAFHDNVAEHYSTVAQMPKVPIKLPRIVEVPLSPGRSSDDTNTYFIAAFRRQGIVDLYAKNAEMLRHRINTTLATNAAGDPAYAAKQYLKTYRDYEELKEAELIMMGAEYNPDPREAFRKLYDYTKAANSQQEVFNYLDTYFQNAGPVLLNTTAGIATLITTQFEIQSPVSSSLGLVQLDPFTYGITEVTGGFSAHFVNVLQHEVATKVQTVLKTNLVSNQVYQPLHPLGFGRGVNSRLTGTYWERGNKVTLRTTLRDVNTGEFQAVAIVRFDKRLLADIRTDRYKPNNYEHILDTRVIEAKVHLGERQRLSIPRPPAVPTPPSPNSEGRSPAGSTSTDTNSWKSNGTAISALHNTGFKVQVRTDKGFGAQTYAVGEKARFFVSVNRGAYLRLLYQQDGKWSQLVEDQYVKPEQASQWLEIPGDFVFAEPLGVGILEVQAKTTPFDPITDFYHEDGYRYIGKPPSDPSTLTTAAKMKEMIAAGYVVKGPINRHFKEDIERVDSQLKGPINRDLEEKRASESVSMAPLNRDIETIRMDASEQTSSTRIYLTTISPH